MQNKKLKSRPQKIKGQNDYPNYKDKRVLQRNLVFVYGLPEELSDTNLLKSQQFLGQYGKIVEIYVYRDNKGKKSNKNVKNVFNAHVTYLTNQEACKAILCLNTIKLNGKSLKATFGLTKFCFFYLKEKNCQKNNCNFYHGNVNSCDTVDIHDQNDERIKKMDIEDIMEYIMIHQIPINDNHVQHDTKPHIFPPCFYAQEMIQKHLNKNQNLQHSFQEKPQKILKNINKFYRGHNDDLLRAQSFNQVSSMRSVNSLTKAKSTQQDMYKCESLKKSLSQTRNQKQSGSFSTDHSLNEGDQKQAQVYYTNYMFYQQQQQAINKTQSQDQLNDSPWFL